MALIGVVLSLVISGSDAPMPRIPTAAERAAIIEQAQQQAAEFQATHALQLHADGGADADHHKAPPPPPGPQAPADLKPELIAPFDTAVQFFQAIVSMNGEDVVTSVKAPFYFEGKAVLTTEEVRKRWGKALMALSTTPLTFYGMELLTWDEMVKKYGKPPQRLADIPSKGAVVAVANINGQPKVALLHKENSGVWQVFAFHD